jgi:hypothetical protein
MPQTMSTSSRVMGTAHLQQQQQQQRVLAKPAAVQVRACTSWESFGGGGSRHMHMSQQLPYVVAVLPAEVCGVAGAASTHIHNSSSSIQCISQQQACC